MFRKQIVNGWNCGSCSSYVDDDDVIKVDY